MVRLVLHVLGQPGMGLLLIGVLGLVVLLGGICLVGLVVHGLFGTPAFAPQTLRASACLHWRICEGRGNLAYGRCHAWACSRRGQGGQRTMAAPAGRSPDWCV